MAYKYRFYAILQRPAQICVPPGQYIFAYNFTGAPWFAKRTKDPDSPYPYYGLCKTASAGSRNPICDFNCYSLKRQGSLQHPQVMVLVTDLLPAITATVASMMLLGHGHTEFEQYLWCACRMHRFAAYLCTF